MAEATPQDYYETFYQSGAARRVFRDLLTEFFFRLSFSPGQPESTAVFGEGERSVMFHIMRMCEAGRPGMTIADQADPFQGEFDPFDESEQVDVFEEPEDDGTMV